MESTLLSGASSIALDLIVSDCLEDELVNQQAVAQGWVTTCHKVDREFGHPRSAISLSYELVTPSKGVLSVPGPQH